jgi:hypothetical protein
MFGEDSGLAFMSDRGSREGRFFFENPVGQSLTVVSGFLKGGFPFFLCLPPLCLVEETDGVEEQFVPIFKTVADVMIGGDGLWGGVVFAQSAILVHGTRDIGEIIS